MSDVEARTAAFWRLVQPLIEAGTVERGTLMGFACVRMAGDFLAVPERATGDLVVKLDRDAVERRVESGEGHPFAPAGRVFREWVRIPDEALWAAALEEAMALRRSS